MDQNLIIEKIKKLPSSSTYKNNKIKNRSNWFAKLLAFLLAIIGVSLGVITILLITLFA